MRNLVSQQVRYSSHAPVSHTLATHNYPSALIAQEAGVDIILVGDSLAMVSLGMADTSEVTLDEMVVHARAVARAAARSFTIGDLPMGSYEISPKQALASAIRMVKEGRMQAVKLEGGQEMAETIHKITSSGIPVCGHVGLTPQRQHALGGFKVQGNTVGKALSLLRDAQAVQDAGAFCIVLECVPQDIAEVVTQALKVPTIGIGAGNKTSGQVLVQIDMLGTRPPDAFMPKFVKKYGDEWTSSLNGIKQYKEEVTSRAYPAPEHNYKSDPKVTEALKAHIREFMEPNQAES
ncbi:cell wall biogenesis and architecture protein [Lithohypha guttulata]|uniref:cell wall biogenesis and architecture protein n=1 Tax=Lithohypha guttulata TaxID=1690604 RepID=UPI00315D0C91